MPFSRTLRDGGDLYDPLASIAPKLSPNGLSPDTFFSSRPSLADPNSFRPQTTMAGLDEDDTVRLESLLSC